MLRTHQSFKSLRLNPNEFYLVILLLGSKWAFIKHNIKRLGTTKTQGFCQKLYGYDLL